MSPRDFSRKTTYRTTRDGTCSTKPGPAHIALTLLTLYIKHKTSPTSRPRAKGSPSDGAGASEAGVAHLGVFSSDRQIHARDPSRRNRQSGWRVVDFYSADLRQRENSGDVIQYAAARAQSPPAIGFFNCARSATSQTFSAWRPSAPPLSCTARRRGSPTCARFRSGPVSHLAAAPSPTSR